MELPVFLVLLLGGATLISASGQKPENCDERKGDINAGLNTGDKNCKNETVYCQWGHCFVPAPEVHENPTVHWVANHWDIFIMAALVVAIIFFVIYLVITDKDKANRVSERAYQKEHQRELYPSTKSKTKKTKRIGFKKKKSSSEPEQPVVFLISEKARRSIQVGEANMVWQCDEGKPGPKEDTSPKKDQPKVYLISEKERGSIQIGEVNSVYQSDDDDDQLEDLHVQMESRPSLQEGRPSK